MPLTCTCAVLKPIRNLENKSDEADLTPFHLKTSIIAQLKGLYGAIHERELSHYNLGMLGSSFEFDILKLESGIALIRVHKRFQPASLGSSHLF